MRSVWKSVLLALAVALLLAAIVLFLIFRYLLPYTDVPEEEPEFVIGEWEGQVAVFEGDDPYPRQVFEVYVDALPPDERQKILVGIPCRDTDQLSLLLEDYTS